MRVGPQMAFTLKHESLIDAFVAATNVPVGKYYDFDDSDRGPNEPEGMRRNWKGAKQTRKF